MPTLATVLAELNAKASEKTRTTYIRHGAPPDVTLGVSVADMKLIARSLKKQQVIALELYATGLFEAQYLAGMVANGAQMTAKELQSWAESSVAQMIFEHTVPWVTVESPNARESALKWIASRKENVAAAGWTTYSGLVAVTPDDALDLKEIEALLNSIPARIDAAPNRVRKCMNSFVIAVGNYVAPLLQQALATATQLGTVAVDVGDTACEIAIASERIAKLQADPRAGAIRC